jgi:Restriction endonuclease
LSLLVFVVLLLKGRFTPNPNSQNLSYVCHAIKCTFPKSVRLRMHSPRSLRIQFGSCSAIFKPKQVNMARRKQKQLIDPKTTLGLLIAFAAIWLIVQNLQRIGIVILIGGGAALAYSVMRHLRRVDARRALLHKSQTIVEQRINPLVRRRAQLVQPDAYGKPQEEKWKKEKDHFVTQHIEPSLSSNERRALQRERALIPDFIEARVELASQSQPAFQNFSDDMTPTEFEVFCAGELSVAGWNARVTKQSCDQGVDVVAEKGDMRVVIQCKKYTRPVGNKSVQEITAAKAHEQAHHGIVVTNNEYTLAAKQLASTNGIWLLHYSDLQKLHCILATGQ